MHWPTPQDYNESIQNPEICLGDSELKRAQVEHTSLGLPRAITGAFASVYKLTGGQSSWAVRCFLTHRDDQHSRYQKVSEFITFDDLDSTVQFRYLDKGIRVRGTWYPILKMDWVEGDTLDIYVAKNYKNRKKMEALAAEFREMALALNQAGIAHGDLQHGNIIVTPHGLRLVDYDALYVPELAGLNCPELGHKNYQHPRRTFVHFGDYLDNFSAWIIYSALTAISIDPDLYMLSGGGDDCLILRRQDLVAPEQSAVFPLLTNHANQRIKQMAGYLTRMLNCAPEVVPGLDADESTLDALKDLESLPPVEHHESAHRSIKQVKDDQIKVRSKSRFGKVGPLLSAHSNRLVRTLTKRIGTMSTKARASIGSIVVRTAPDLWVAVLIDAAKDDVKKEDFLAAISKYSEALDIHRTLPQPSNEVMIQLMIELGCCFGLKHNTPMSASYFMQALNTSVENKRDVNVRRAALLLGSARMADHNAKLAITAMENKVVPFWLMDWVPDLLEHAYAREPYIARALATLAEFYAPQYGNDHSSNVYQAATAAYDAAIAKHVVAPNDLLLEAAAYSMRAGYSHLKAEKMIEAEGSFQQALTRSAGLDPLLQFRSVIALSTVRYKVSRKESTKESVLTFAMKRLPPVEIMVNALEAETTGTLGTTRALYVFLLKFAYKLRREGLTKEAKIVYSSMIPSPLKHAHQVLLTSLEKAACFLGIDQNYDVRGLLNKYQPRQENAALEDLLSHAAELASSGHYEEARIIYKKVEGPDSINAAEMESKMRNRRGGKK